MSYLRYEIEKIFADKIESVYKHRPEVVKWLMNHERKKLCIENLETEVRKAELSMAGKFKKKELDYIVNNYALTFARAAIELKRQDDMHYLEKDKIVKQAKDREEVMQMFESEDKSESLDG